MTSGIYDCLASMRMLVKITEKRNLKMNKKTSRITVVIAILAVSLCVSVMGSMLAMAQSSADGVLQTVAEETTLGVGDNLNFMVVTEPFTLPEGSLSAQYAAAIAEEWIFKAFGQIFTGRIGVYLNPLSSYRESYLWYGEAETADGKASFEVDTETGDLLSLRYNAGESDWSYFDSTTQETENKIRSKNMEEEMRCRKIDQEQGEPVLSAEGEDWLQREMTEKAMEAKQAALEHSDSPLLSAAIEWVNSRDLSDGAKAVSANIYLDSTMWDGYEEAGYGIEVVLDNGKYIRLDMKNVTGEVTYFVPPCEGRLLETWYCLKHGDGMPLSNRCLQDSGIME